MTETRGDIWLLANHIGSWKRALRMKNANTLPDWIVVPTNGTWQRGDGRAVMGAGLAAAAAEMHPQLPFDLGPKLRLSGNHVFSFERWRIITFPVKNLWMDDADPALIAQSTDELTKLADDLKLEKVFLPRVGCGNGRLRWADVRKILATKLDDRFVIVAI